MGVALLAYSARRIALFVPTFVAITLIGFLIMRLAPGDPVELALSGGLGSGQTGLNAQKLADVEKEKARLRAELGLDRPLVVQYTDWLVRFVSGDLGRSFKDHQAVWDKIRERLPVTVAIDLISLFIAYLVAVPLGIYSAVRPGSRFDQLSTVVIFMLYAVPSFWLGVMLIVFFCSGDYLHWFPAGGLRSLHYSEEWSLGQRLGDLLHHLALPLFVTSLGSYTELSRYLRSSMLENARQDFVRTARAKGVPERTVILKHMLRNSLIPMVTILGGLLPGLIGGSVIIENLFSIPGLGQLGYQAVLARDYPVVLALFAASSGLTLIGFLVSDVLLALVDPRVTFTSKTA